MNRRPPHRPNWVAAWANRIDRAAGEVNPFLIVIAIGLFVLNLISFALLSANRPLVRRLPGAAAEAAPGPPTAGPAVRLGGLQ